jgi:hypothetical protein
MNLLACRRSDVTEGAPSSAAGEGAPSSAAGEGTPSKSAKRRKKKAKSPVAAAAAAGAADESLSGADAAPEPSLEPKEAAAAEAWWKDTGAM